ncbi:MAG: AAA family ATPase [Actinobacteria bacterium]|nr:AAA family ATPase [Actinomycetota bacterium]
MRKIAILNFKGGTGETTTAANLGHALSLKDFSEILSMGLEYFYNDPIKLTTKDPGIFDSIYNAVREI